MLQKEVPPDTEDTGLHNVIIKIIGIAILSDITKRLPELQKTINFSQAV